MNSTVENMLNGIEWYNSRLAPYSWIIPVILLTTALVLAYKCISNKGNKFILPYKIFLALVYLYSGVTVWLGLEKIDLKAAYSGSVILSVYGILFLMDAFWWKKISFRIPEQADLKISMFLLMLLGVFYPVFEVLFGYTWPRMVFFGAECPTTTFVIGLLIGSLPKTNKWMLGIFAANAIMVGGYVGFNGFMVDALTYLPAGIMGIVMLIRYRKK